MQICWSDMEVTVFIQLNAKQLVSASSFWKLFEILISLTFYNVSGHKTSTNHKAALFFVFDVLGETSPLCILQYLIEVKC